MGHVTGIASATETVTNTDINVRQTLTSANWNLPLLMSYQYNTVTSTNVDNIVYRSNSIYANPSEGTITAKLKGNIYGQFLGQADVETVSAGRYVYVKLGTFDYNAFGTLCVHLEGNVIKDELYINYGSGNAYSPSVCGWYAGHQSNVKEIDIVYGTSWNGSCELWLRVYQLSTLNIAVFRTIRGDGFIVNTAANWSATTTSPTFNKKIPLIHGMFGDLSGNASSASKLTTNAGSATQPVYFSEGVPTACSYQLNKTVPSDAVFTDTTYSSKSEANGGTDVSLVTTGEKYNWNRKSNLVLGNTSYTALAGSTKYAGSSTQGGAATSAEKLTNTSNIGNTNQPVYFTASGVPTAISYTINETAPSSSSDDSTVPTSKAVWTAVSNGIAAADAMIYRGTIAGGNTGAYGTLTPFANNGWTYKVTTAGKINGKAVEIGDMLICNKDGTTAATSSNYSTIAANWDVIQANIDGAVTGPASSTNAHVAVFNGATGKVIKDSGLTIAKSVPSNAVFTDTHYTTHLYAGSGTAANAATTNGNTKLTVVDNATTRNSVTIKGTGGTTVTSDANGVVTIDSTDVSSKQFTFDNPQTTSSSGYDFIIIPNGYNSCPSGTCYFVEITALISKNSSWVTRYVKFMTHCKWYASNAGIRTTDPVCTYGYVSNSPIFYHDEAEGADVGTETRNSNVCIIPFNIPITSGLASVNIKVEGPNVSRCICDRSYSSWKWSSVEPSWTST